MTSASLDSDGKPRGSKYPTFTAYGSKTIPLMDLGTRVLTYWVLGPSLKVASRGLRVQRPSWTGRLRVNAKG